MPPRRKRKAAEGVMEATAAAGGRRRRDPSPPPQLHAQAPPAAPPAPPTPPAAATGAGGSVAHAQAQDPQPLAGDAGVLEILMSLRSDIQGFQQRQAQMEQTICSLQASLAAATQGTGPLNLQVPPTPLQGHIQPVAGPVPPSPLPPCNLPTAGPSASSPDVHPEARRMAEEMMGRRAVGNGEPVDLFIDNKIRQRILAHEAIDLALLLPKANKAGGKWLFSNNEDGYSVSHIPDNRKSSLEKNQWRDAWLIYSTIYTKQYPELVDGLNAHAKVVYELMDNNNDWAGYDFAFRKMVERNANVWGDTNSALYSKAAARRQPFVKNMQSKHKKQHNAQKVPHGHCYDFHYKLSCGRQQCKYKHTCPKCGGEHPSAQCTATQPEGEQQPFRKRGSNGSSKSK